MRLALAAAALVTSIGTTLSAAGKDLSAHVTSTFKVGQAVDDNEREAPFLAIFDVSKAVHSCMQAACEPVVSLFVYNHNYTKERTVNIQCKALDVSGSVIARAAVSPTLAPYGQTITAASFDTMDVGRFASVDCEIASINMR